MKKTLVWMLIALLLSLSCAPALAAVPAVPNQKLAMRTGPNTKYSEIDMLPKSTKLTAIEYEKGNDVTWVMVEFNYHGMVARGYTGLKRMEVQGTIPWASHMNKAARIRGGGTVLAAPTGKGDYRGRLYDGDSVTILRYEGNYAYIEFYDETEDRPSRGYVPTTMISGSQSSGGSSGGDSSSGSWFGGGSSSGSGSSGAPSAVPNQNLAFRTGPNTRYVELEGMPMSTRVRPIETEEGNGVTWVLVEFTRDGEKERAYTGLKRLDVRGRLPRASHMYLPVSIRHGCIVYGAPDYNAAYRGFVEIDSDATLLAYTNGFAYIEFYDEDAGAPSRGYVPSDMIS